MEYELLEVSTQHENQRFKFKLEVPDNPQIDVVYSNPFSVVYFLIVTYNKSENIS